MLKEFMWFGYSLGGLIGLISRQPHNTYPPEPEEVVLQAGRYADAMMDEYRNRFLDGWKGK